MNATPDLLDITLEAVSKVVPLTGDQLRAADLKIRHAIGGSKECYVRKKSVYLREVILARYTGTVASLRALAVEYQISETTVRRIARGRINRGATAVPTPAPRLVAKKLPNSP